MFRPSTRTTPSKVTVPVAVASRCFRLLPGPLTDVSTGPTPVHVTSNVTKWVPPRLSLAIPDPNAWTLLRFAVLVIVAGAVGAAQLKEVPSGQNARNCTLAVGSESSLSGALKSRVLRTSSVACTVEQSAHVCHGRSQRRQYDEEPSTAGRCLVHLPPWICTTVIGDY